MFGSATMFLRLEAEYRKTLIAFFGVTSTRFSLPVMDEGVRLMRSVVMTLRVLSMAALEERDNLLLLTALTPSEPNEAPFPS